MKIKVKYYGSYIEAFISDGNTTIESGLLNEEEAASLAFQFESAAAEIRSFYNYIPGK